MSTAPRRKLACRICTRRKVRCDKQIPCGNCVRRGTLGDCERDEPEDLSPHNDTATGRRFSEDAAATALTALRTRVAELEAALQDKNAGAEPAQSPAIATPQPQSPSPSVSPSQDSDIQDAVTVLEFLAWGRMKDPDRAMLSPEALKVSEHDDGSATSPAEELDAGVNPLMNVLSWLQILLPSQRQVYQLVQYHNECLLWFHGSYFASTFSRELALFYSDHHGRIGSDGVNLQWVALLFSIIAGTMTSAPAHETRKWGFDDSEARLLSQKWYKAVVTALNAANYTACHSIHSVQAVATLTNTAHMLGHSNTQSVLLASAVRIAQSLGLHRLDETASGQNSRHDAPLYQHIQTRAGTGTYQGSIAPTILSTGSEDARGAPIKLETGRRVWQELCIQDWFSTAFSETYSINPLHSTSLPPGNCDEDMNVLPESEPTITSFCRFLAKIAAIMPALQDAMALGNTLYTKHEAVLVHDRKMRSLATGRPHFLANTAFDENWPCYIPWARRAIAMSSAHKIIMIHRKFLGLSFTNPVFTFTRRTCLAASKTILKEYLASSKDESSPMLWTHQAFSVAACITICFDILHSSTSGQDESLLVDQTLEHLQSCRQRSMIAARGVKVLNALQKQIANRAGSRKRGMNAATSHTRDGESPRKRRRRGFDAAELARSFCDIRDDDAESPQLASTEQAISMNRQNHSTGPHPRPLPSPQRQRNDDTSQSAGLEESTMFNPSLPPDLNWSWSMPISDDDGNQTFDSLLSFANQGLGF